MSEKNKELVVVVDDDFPIALLLEEYLKITGYRALAFSDPKKAFDSMLGIEETVDLLVTNYNMPLINGVELARETRLIFPNIKVVCIFELLRNDKYKDVLRCSDFDGFLEKPFLLERFIRVVKKVL